VPRPSYCSSSPGIVRLTTADGFRGRTAGAICRHLLIQPDAAPPKGQCRDPYTGTANYTRCLAPVKVLKGVRSAVRPIFFVSHDPFNSSSDDCPAFSSPLLLPRSQQPATYLSRHKRSRLLGGRTRFSRSCLPPSDNSSRQGNLASLTRSSTSDSELRPLALVPCVDPLAPATSCRARPPRLRTAPLPPAPLRSVPSPHPVDRSRTFAVAVRRHLPLGNSPPRNGPMATATLIRLVGSAVHNEPTRSATRRDACSSHRRRNSQGLDSISKSDHLHGARPVRQGAIGKVRLGSSCRSCGLNP